MNSYLKFDSAHPPKCKESLPYSQFIRIKRICKKETDFEKHIQIKCNEFKEKGYPQKVLTKALEKTKEKSRQEL